eukprot:scaffold256193_cov41-Prasinocladus_malaysianus.AAC.1
MSCGLRFLACVRVVVSPLAHEGADFRREGVRRPCLVQPGPQPPRRGHRAALRGRRTSCWHINMMKCEMSEE